jgi:hypothetical protein
MKVLHILKSEPDDTVVDLMGVFEDEQVETVKLDDDGVDWEGLVDRIFAADKVICWW